MNKKIILLLLVLSLIFVGCAREEEKDIVAIVNDENLYQEDFDKRLSYLKRQIEDMYAFDFDSEEGKEWLSVLEARILEDMIWEKIFIQQSKNMEITVSSAEIEERLTMIKNQYQSEEDFKQFLEEMSYTESEYGEIIEEQLLIEKVLASITDDIEIPDEDIIAHFEEYRSLYDLPDKVAAKHLLYESEDDANKVWSKIEAGESFNDFMDQGQDLGYLARGETVKEFEEVLFNMEKGEIRGPVETIFGHHIIYVYDILEGEEASIEDVYEEIYTHLKNERSESVVNEYMQNLFEKTEFELVGKFSFLEEDELLQQ